MIMMDKNILYDAGYDIPNISMLENVPGNDTSEISASGSSSDENEWSEASTRFLLDKYAEYLELVGPMKKFKTKKIMWMQIAEDIEKTLGLRKTYIQCENRYKTIRKRKRICEKNNSTSGAKRVKIDFENEMRAIAAVDDSIEPEILQSANKVIEKSSNVTQKVSNIKYKKAKPTLLQTLVKLHEEKEEQKQKRHEEKMQLLKSILEKGNFSN